MGCFYNNLVPARYTPIFEGLLIYIDPRRNYVQVISLVGRHNYGTLTNTSGFRLYLQKLGKELESGLNIW